MEREIIALISVDEEQAFEKIDDGPFPYLEKKIAGLNRNGIHLIDGFVADNDEPDAWQAYINYLCKWALSHSDPIYAGKSPNTFNEWKEVA